MNVRVRTLFFLLAVALLAVPAGAQVINGCVGQNGVLRIVAAGEACRSSEAPISWNAVGPQGPPGPSAPPPSVTGTIQFDSGAVIDIYDAGAEFLNPASVSSGGGGGAGKIVFKDLTISKKPDATTPALFLKCATGTHFQKVTISMHRAQGDDAVIELGTVFVADIKYGTAPAPVNSLEEVSLAFAKVKVTVDGASACWNIVTNTSNCP